MLLFQKKRHNLLSFSSFLKYFKAFRVEDICFSSLIGSSLVTHYFFKLILFYLETNSVICLLITLVIIFVKPHRICFPEKSQDMSKAYLRSCKHLWRKILQRHLMVKKLLLFLQKGSLKMFGRVQNVFAWTLMTWMFF